MLYQKGAATAMILAGAVLIFFSVYSYQAITAEAPTLEPKEELPVIVIDAGHGGFDGGAVGVGGVVEKDINLSIAQKLYDLFTIQGFEAVLTRDEDEALDGEGDKTTRKRKNTDIHNRFELAKSYPNAILLSIHQNHFSQSSQYGAQVFYGPKNEYSAQLGEIMQRRLVEMLQPENKRLQKPCGSNVYLIYHAPMPSLLIECGFISNPEDARKLVTGEYQRSVSFAIFAGTMEYLGLEYTPAAQDSPLPVLPAPEKA